MAEMDLLLKALDTGIWELGEAFTGMPDEDLWKRPHPRLLSVGELAAHIAYGEAIHFLGKDFESFLLTPDARYYPVTLEQPLQMSVGAEAVYAEVKRVHEACKAAFLEISPEASAQNPHRAEWTWGAMLEYQVFHVAYHTGQIYSVRHLLGHETVDN